MKQLSGKTLAKQARGLGSGSPEPIPSGSSVFSALKVELRVPRVIWLARLAVLSVLANSGFGWDTLPPEEWGVSHMPLHSQVVACIRKEEKLNQAFSACASK